MSSTGLTLSNFVRVLAAFRVLTGLGILAFVGILVFEFREHSFIWDAVGGVTLLLLKGWFALMVGYRFLRHGESARIRPAEWRILGVGYCIVASTFLLAAVAAEGWAFVLLAPFVATIAPVWFVLGWRAERDVAC